MADEHKDEGDFDIGASIQTEFEGLRLSTRSSRAWDFNYGDLSEMLNQTKQHFESGDYFRTLDLVESSVASAESYYDEFIRLMLCYSLLSGREAIARLKDYDIDVSEAYKLLSRLNGDLELKKLREVERGSVELKELLLRLQEELVQNTRSLINETRDLIDDARKIDTDVDKAQSMQREAAVLFDGKNYLKAAEIIQSAKKLATQAYDATIEKIGTKIPEVWGLIEEARRFGADVSELEAMHGDIKEAFELKDYPRARRNLDRTAETARRHIKERVRKAMQLLDEPEPEKPRRRADSRKDERSGTRVTPMEVYPIEEPRVPTYDPSPSISQQRQVTPRGRQSAPQSASGQYQQGQQPHLRMEPVDRTGQARMHPHQGAQVHPQQQVQQPQYYQQPAPVYQQQPQTGGNGYQYQPGQHVQPQSQSQARGKPTQKTTIKCPNCTQVFEIEHTGKLKEIQCPYCGLKGSV